MSAPPMDPQYEQRLRDEVIYLHSLWHQGPPRAASTIFRHPLPPNQPTHFKRVTHNTNIKKNTIIKKKPESSSPGAEWPCPPTPPSVSTEWPTLPKQLSPKPHVTPEEKSKFSGLKAQKNALEVARKFFLQNGGGGDDDNVDSDGILSSDNESDDELMELEGDDVREVEYGFFVKLLMQDAELKEYYVKYFMQGEFSCLVCGALGGKKMVKKYGSCMALVQHSVAISKTKRRQAHRAFGQAICKVLGWDIDHLPAVASLLSEKKMNADSVIKEINVDSIGDVVSLPSKHTSSDVHVNVDLANKESVSLTPSACNLDSVKGNTVGVVAESGTAVSLSSEHTSGNIELNVDMPTTKTNVDLVADVVPLPSEHTSTDVQLNVGLADEESLNSIPSACNFNFKFEDSMLPFFKLETSLEISNRNVCCDEETACNMDAAEDNIGGLASGDTQNANSDNKDTSVADVCNVDPVEGNISRIKPASGASGSGV